MTTLITGAGGFLGGKIARQLLTAGEAVRGLDVAWPSGPPAGFDARTGSILDPRALDDALTGVDHVIHCAALAQLWVAERGAHQRVNAEGTACVVAAARRSGASMVHVSSYTTLIGRDVLTDQMLDEGVEHPVDAMLGPYPRSKRSAELAIAEAAGTGQPVTTVMPAAPIGAGDSNLTPPTAMIRDLAAGRVPALLNCRLNLVDVRAVAAACIAARAKGVPGQRYLLSGDDIALLDLAERIAAKTGVKAPRARVPLAVALGAAHVGSWISAVTGRPPAAPLTGVRLAARPVRFSSAKAREVLGFSPRPIAVCLDEALAWLRDRGHLDR